MFRVSKKCYQDFRLLHAYYTCYTSYFWVKSDEKWLTYNVFFIFESCKYFLYIIGPPKETYLQKQDTPCHQIEKQSRINSKV
jgi:hypothetical protein